jgi:hypothetical protein
MSDTVQNGKGDERLHDRTDLDNKTMGKRWDTSFSVSNHEKPKIKVTVNGKPQ